MPIMFLSDVQKDDRFEGFLLVRSAERRTSQNGSQYLDMTLGDKTGEINAKMWDGTPEPPPSGCIIRVRALVTEYNGRLQMRVERFRLKSEGESVPLEALVPCAPRAPEEMLRDVREAIGAMGCPDLRALMDALVDSVEAELLYFPAASKLHHAERGGLLSHITSMMRMAVCYADEYPFLDRDLLMAGVIAHDIAKIGELNASELGSVSDYTADGMLIGHLVRGVSRIDAIGRKTGCDEETLLILEHMVLSHHGIAEYGSPKPPMFPEAEVLSMLDMLDARLNEMRTTLARVRPGCFSERLWSLDRKLYRRQEKAGKETP
ncbi:MAG: HD domain-containing protein [Clostridia bacterium]|nr:HD domain-containing protein [Clostridia bacterium]